MPNQMWGERRDSLSPS